VCTLHRRLKIREKSANLANFEIIIAHLQTKKYNIKIKFVLLLSVRLASGKKNFVFFWTLRETSRIRFVPKSGTNFYKDIEWDKWEKKNLTLFLCVAMPGSYIK
jgi:hypothetical protein